MTTEYVNFCNNDDCNNNDTFEPVEIYQIKTGEKLELLQGAIDIREDKRHGTHICECCLDTMHEDFPNLLTKDNEDYLIINRIISEDESLHTDLIGDDYERQKEIYKLCEVGDDSDN